MQRKRPEERGVDKLLRNYFGAPPLDERYRGALLRGIHHAWVQSERKGPPTGGELEDTLRPYVEKHKPGFAAFPFLDPLVRSGLLQHSGGTYRLTADGIADLALNNIEEDWYERRLAAATTGATVAAAFFGPFGVLLGSNAGVMATNGIEAQTAMQTRIDSEIAKLIKALPEQERAQFALKLARADASHEAELAKLVKAFDKLGPTDVAVLKTGVRLTNLEQSPYGLSVVPVRELVEAMYADPDVRNLDEVVASLRGLSGESWDDPAAMVRPWGDEKKATWYVFNSKARQVVEWMNCGNELAEHTGRSATLGL